jgi:hypothetical protein
MKSKDQQLLEEAYEKVVAEANNAAAEKFKREAYNKLVRDAKKVNPTWDETIPFTSGNAFKGLSEPKGGWPDREGKKSGSKNKSNTSPKPKNGIAKAKKTEQEYDLDVEGEPVGSYQSISEPEPEQEKKDITMSFDFLDNVQTNDPELYNIITGVAKGVEQHGDKLKFTYTADNAKDIEFFIQNYKR